jgi:hypothetical protein
MKRYFVLAIAAATISAAIPAEAATTGGRGDTGKGGRTTTCFVGKEGKKARTCGVPVAGTSSRTLP